MTDIVYTESILDKDDEMKTQAHVQPSYSASDIAQYFIWKAKQEGTPITNKKLQKLLYYSQAWHLVFNNGKPLFKDDIEAWVHGPVVRSVYKALKKFGFDPIVYSKTSNPVDAEKTSFLDQVWNIYGGFDAEYLEMLTHREKPWQDARMGVDSKERSRVVIDLGIMREYYQMKLNATAP